MKKMFALLLAAVMLVSVTACAATPPDAAKPKDASDPEESTKTQSEMPLEEERIRVEALLQEGQTVTVTFNTEGEYEALLHELGYTEIALDYRHGTQVACKPTQLTYNDKAFRFAFDWLDNPVVYNETGAELNLDGNKIYEGWILYGTKGDAAVNISELVFEDYPFYDSYDPLEFMTTEATRALPQCPRYLQTNCVDAEYHLDWKNTAYHSAWYYPATGNLYNYVYTASSLEAATLNEPRVLASWNRVLAESLEAAGLPGFSFVLGTMKDAHTAQATYTGHIYLRDVECFFEPGMNLEQWARSGYNLEGWIYDDSGEISVLRYPYGDYVIPLARDEQGELLPLEAYATAYGYEIVIVTAENYNAYSGK